MGAIPIDSLQYFYGFVATVLIVLGAKQAQAKLSAKHWRNSPLVRYWRFWLWSWPLSLVSSLHMLMYATMIPQIFMGLFLNSTTLFQDTDYYSMFTAYLVIALFFHPFFLFMYYHKLFTNSWLRSKIWSVIRVVVLLGLTTTMTATSAWLLNNMTELAALGDWLQTGFLKTIIAMSAIQMVWHACIFATTVWMIATSNKETWRKLNRQLERSIYGNDPYNFKKGGEETPWVPRAANAGASPPRAAGRNTKPRADSDDE